MSVLKKIMVMGLVGAVVPAAPAFAQDDWTGPYVGGHASYSYQRGDTNEFVTFDTDLNGSFNDTVRNSSGDNVFVPGFCSGSAEGPSPSDGCREDGDNFEAGVHAGYDWQLQENLLVGLVASYSRSKAGDSVTAFSTTPANYTLSRELRNLYSVRGRMGYIIEDTLIYATGGASYGEVHNSFESSNTANTFVEFDDNGSWGFEIGGGAEHRITDNIALGVQYLYRELGGDNYVVRAAPGTTGASHPFRLENPNGTDMRRSTDDFDTQAVEVTANYRF